MAVTVFLAFTSFLNNYYVLRLMLFSVLFDAEPMNYTFSSLKQII